MEPFSELLALCAGNLPVTGEFPLQRPVARSFDVSFDLRLNEGWVNNREAGDLRRHRAHYDVIIMIIKTYRLVTRSAPAQLLHEYTMGVSLYRNIFKSHHTPQDSCKQCE